MVAAMPTVSQAQDNDGTTEPKRINNAMEQKRIRDYGLHLTAGLDLLYDDNVYRVDDRVENPTDDLIVTPSLEATYGMPVGRHDILLRGKIGYDRFISEGQRSKLRLDTEAKANIRFGATCLITPRASYRQQRADYGDINSATENLQKFATVGADFTCERPGLFPVASYEHDRTRNADQFDYADQTSDMFMGGIGYAMPSLGTLTVYYERVNSKRDTLGIENRINSYGLRFQRAVTPITQIDADVRWLDVSSDSAAVGGYDGLGWKVSLSTQAIPRLKLTAMTERAIVNDSLIASGFAIDTSYRIQGEFSISELTSAGLYAEWDRRKFRQDAALRPYSITADRNRRFGGLLTRKLSDRFDLTLDAQHYTRRTDTSVSNYSGTQVTLGAALHF
ncbi:MULTISPECIES: hypothetical protein [Sphingobium]|uniref:Outer membrane beta-barrel protein n=1 Tax=Sphingobium fuliginis (strain ATCC 27551) TaxID=336203 RepID=A0ABQ1EUM9_SPHSA|nr:MULTISPECIES: hypothetical protein [Sphingobium]AJR25598.1 hypothetical protein TZ53_19525 [Sphingobium sp. YBL2]RYL98897.1 hypothetical protein EWH10_10460 [Sphingobium fuliginis]GFZ88048.1 hypothetical protein GCM10019071_17050 [Sphingobium fuliginis]